MDAVHQLDVPPHERVRLTTQLVPTRRGDRLADRVTVRVLGPLGLAARQRSVAVPGSIRALHAFPSRKHLPSRLAVLRQLDGRAAVRIRGQGTEFDSLRDYVEGDDVRSIDWRATARRQHLVVRTWQPEQHRRVVIVLDTSRTSAGRIGDAPRLDAAMDAALLLTALAGHARDRVQVIAGDRVVHARISGADRARLLHDTISTLAPVESRLVEADWSALATEVVRLGSHRALVVLLTALESSAVEEGLLPVLPALVAHHRVVVASVSRPGAVERCARPVDHRRGLRRGSRGTDGGAAPPHGLRARAARRRRHRRLPRPAAGTPGRPLPHAQAPGPALSRSGALRILARHHTALPVVPLTERRQSEPRSGRIATVGVPDVPESGRKRHAETSSWVRGGADGRRCRRGLDPHDGSGHGRPGSGSVRSHCGGRAGESACRAAHQPGRGCSRGLGHGAAELVRLRAVFGRRTECATVTLPLDYDTPRGPTTEVAILRIRATDPKHRIGSLFLNPGGPGGSGVEFAAAAPRFLSRSLLARFDIVGMDPRGTNYSDDVRCWRDFGSQSADLVGPEPRLPVHPG